MRLGRHVEIAGDREQAFEHPADRDLLDRQAADRLAGGAQSGRELVDVVMRRDILRLEMDFGDAAVIAGDQPVEDLGEPDARAAVDPAHDPEIDRADPSVGKREQIAVVQVGVEEAVDHRLAQEGANQDAASALQSCPAAISASRSLSLIPSSHSSVSTRRAVRRQSISGT